MKMTRWVGMILFGLLSGCAAQHDELSPYRDQSMQAIIHQAEQAMEQKHFHQAVEAFRAASILYPYSPNADYVQCQLIYANYRADDLISAQLTAHQFVERFPQSQCSAYAYFMVGLIAQTQGYTWLQEKAGIDLAWRDLQQQKLAFQAFDVIVRHYPGSPYAANALHRLRVLREVFARKAFDLARFYYEMGALVAAKNRLHECLIQYDGTKVSSDAAKLLIQVDHQLGLPEEAGKVQVLVDQRRE